MSPTAGGVDGVLLLDKPSGPTSHDMVDLVRHRFGFEKVGHGGTLDPMATGLLVILLGKATKLSARFMASDKTYEGTLTLGISTSSYDRDGEVTRTADPTGVTAEALTAAMAALTGDMMQTPPMVSAVKVGGVPLYKLARKGKEVEREPRLVHVFEFSLLDFDPPEAGFRVRCTKGTYVRSLAHEAGERLGCGAHLSALRRTASGEFAVAEALTEPELAAMTRSDVARRVLPLSRFLSAAWQPRGADL